MQQPATSATESNISDVPGFFDTVDSPTRQTDQSATSEVSVSEAAKLLGITERSVWRRIRQKKLISQLKDGRTIVSVQMSDMSLKRTDASVTTSIEANDVIEQNQSDAPEGALYLIVAKQAEKLEGASYRIGFLEADLAAAREQVKLIPDLQARASELEQMKIEVARLTKELDRRNRTPWNHFVSWLKGNGAGA